jgi:hypothetical protein
MGIIVLCTLSGSNSLNQSITITVRAGVASFQIPFRKFLMWEILILQLAELQTWLQLYQYRINS